MDIKKIATFSIALLLVLVGPASAQSISVSSGTVTLGQSMSINGDCTARSVSAIPIVVSQGIVTDTVGSVVFGPNASTNFSGTANFGLFSELTSGPAVLTVLCPGNQGNVSTQINIIDPNGSPNPNVPIGTSLSFNGNTNLGTSFGVSGMCGTNPAGSTVNLSVTQNGVTSNLGSITTTGTGGSFNSNVTFGNGIVAGPAVITATCPGTGNVITSSVNISDPNAAGGTDTGGTNTGGGSTTGGTNTGTTGGVSTTPVGGVAAGKSLNFLIGLALILVGVSGFVFSTLRKNQISLQ
ncbi:MAG: hypothetical protein KW804_01105 [Candidatus Doudnabacteria bacterium]|nr:hypothetical protein [Candidatus Doudnabacteria bacterium]